MADEVRFQPETCLARMPGSFHNAACCVMSSVVFQRLATFESLLLSCISTGAPQGRSAVKKTLIQCTCSIFSYSMARALTCKAKVLRIVFGMNKVQSPLTFK